MTPARRIAVEWSEPSFDLRVGDSNYLLTPIENYMVTRCLADYSQACFTVKPPKVQRCHG